MKQLEAGEVVVGDIFSSSYDFRIPDYQRPYAWDTEQTIQLFEDLQDALDRNADEPYFLGSIVLVKAKGSPSAEVIDGQQRLTTLTILLAVLKDLTSNQQLAAEFASMIQEPGKILGGLAPKPRLALRKRDRDFFRTYVQEPDSLDALLSLKPDSLTTDAQKNVRENARALKARLQDWPESRREALSVMIGTRTFLVVVSTPDLESAHRIFSVMNSRGLDLSPADIFKSMIIGAMPDDVSDDYAEKWEDSEQALGRDAFSDLFLHVRMIFAKERAKRELLKEFPLQVLHPHYLPASAKEFIDEVVVPYAQAYENIENQDYKASAGADEVNQWLRRLVQLDNNDWRPPALWALTHHREDPAWLNEFLRRLERLAASMFIRRVYATPRSNRYAELLKQLEANEGANAGALDLTETEKTETVGMLSGDVYTNAKTRKFVLLRLDETLSKSTGATYDHKVITVEHVLPRHPSADGEWTGWFTDNEREMWTHKLANLVLLNRVKNSEAQNYEFNKKKQKYFSSKNGVSTFALTSQVLASAEWTPDLLTSRQKMLLDLLATTWDLG